MNKIRQYFKRLFCKHEYCKVGFVEVEENNIRFPLRHYICQKCNREIWIDGRKDFINN